MNILLYGFEGDFLDVCRKLFVFDTVPKHNEYDIIALSEKCPELPSRLRCTAVLCARSVIYRTGIRAKAVITVGMDDRSTLSFSSITYGSAMLSISRCFELFGKRYMFGERKVDYRESFTVFENLILLALGMFA